MKKKTLLLLGLILFLGAFLRIALIGVVPPSPDWDEAALGYNAYSIMLTGRDEYGKFLPVVLRSFDDYKPALYAYLIIPFIKIFGLNIIAVRLPSILFGIVSIAVVFFLVKLLFASEYLTMNGKRISTDALGLVTAFLLAISPWHIQFSRVAFEAQVGLSFDLLSLLFFFMSFKRRWLLAVSVFMAALSIYTYQSEKVYLPLLALLLLALYWRTLISFPKKVLVGSVLVGLVAIMPMLFYIVTTPDSLLRAKGVSIFSHQAQVLDRNTTKLQIDAEHQDLLGQVLDNRRFEYANQIAAGYLSHFSPNWLLIKGDDPRHEAPYMGLIYLFEFPLIIIGIYMLIFLKIDKRVKFFIFGYILLAPIPASITIDVPHAVRTIHFLPGIQILTALGIFTALTFIRSRIHMNVIRYVLYGLFCFIALINVSYYLNQYFVQQNYFASDAWQYGWKDAVDYVWDKHEKFDKVIVSNLPPLDQSYIFFLYYLKYDPVKYQQAGGTGSGGFLNEHSHIENIEFRPIDWSKDSKLKHTLFVGRPDDLPVNIDKTINYLNGQSAIEVSAKYD